MLNLYSVFYLNILFSSLSVEDRPIVIKKCYWPLLDLIERGFKIGVQPAGTTLEIIQELDPAWIVKFKQLLKEKKCELIGDGYAHVIAPLVPAEVNHKNLALGRQMYRTLLGVRPTVASVCEMAYSAGLPAHFLKNGYRAIMMDWNNSAQSHPEWNREWRYHPQIAVGSRGERIPVIWSNFVAFQKFQRYVNGIIELDEFLKYLRSHNAPGKERFFLLYGSDTEIFDFRTRRFATKIEGKESRGEWKRIQKLFEALSAEKNIQLILPSEVLMREKSLSRNMLGRKSAFNEISPESSEDPIPVKKQEKYNITRWGLSGHSMAINTQCYALYENIKHKKSLPLWKELCYLWSSDFRTHIERARFKDFQKRLAWILKATATTQTEFGAVTDPNSVWGKRANITRTRRYLNIETSNIKIVLNLHKGLSIDSLVFKKVSDKPLLGGFTHDYYDDVRFAVDWFSGHSVIGVPGKSQMTDLDPVRPTITKENGAIVVKAKVPLYSASRHQDGGGWVEKKITIFPAEVQIDYRFNFLSPDALSWRAGFLTLRPEAFDSDDLFFSCHNGGAKEVFSLRGANSIEKNPVSHMVSAPSALGNIKGELEVGDKKKKILIKTNMAQCAALPMIQFQSFPGTFFLRLFYSLGEIDDTTTRNFHKERHKAHFTMTISALSS